MVSGWYVPPSWSQNLAQLANTAIGVYGGKMLDEEKAQKTAEALRRFEGVEEEVPMQNIPGVKPNAAMAEGQSRPEDAPQQTPMPQEMLAPQKRMRPLTQDEQDMALLNLAQINPTVGSIYGTLLGTRATRAERAAEKVEQRAWQERENEKNRQSREDMIRLSAGFAAANRTPASEKPLTEFQGKSMNFGTRAAEADKILNNTNYNPTSVEGVRRTGILGNFFAAPETQKALQAQRDFVNATLRQESGAAISNSEFENAQKQYFPQPGDTPEVIAQKAANRATVIKGFARQAGPNGGRDVAEVYNAPYAAPQVQQPVQQSPQAGRLGQPQGAFSIRPKQ